MSWLTIGGVIWVVLAAALLGVLTYRSTLAEKEDDSVHLVGGDVRIDEQTEFIKKMEVLDRWVKILGVANAVFGVVYLGGWAYSLM